MKINKEKRKIYVVLTKTNTIFARTIRMYTKTGYSHASISLDDDFNTLYSFSRKYTNNPFIGRFRKENIYEGVFGKCDQLPCLILEKEIDLDQYNIIKNKLLEMENSNYEYKYNYLGVFFAIFNKRYNSKDRYYCSEFVYYLLRLSNSLDNMFDNKPIHPMDFLKFDFNLFYEGNLKEFKNNNILDIA